MPPAFRNNLGPTASDNPAFSAACSLFNPAAIPCQNSSCSARPATGGRPKDPSFARVDRFFRMPIATSASEVLRRPIDSAGCSGEPVVTCLRAFYFCTQGCGCVSCTGIPCALCFGGDDQAQLGRIMPREGWRVLNQERKSRRALESEEFLAQRVLVFRLGVFHRAAHL